MDCAFDEDAFDAVAFDVCISPSIVQDIPRGGGARNRVIIFNKPMRDDEDVLLAWSMLEEII